MRGRLSAAGVWLAPLAMMALIFALSAMPAGHRDHGLAYLLLRKTAHFTEFALLAALWWRALRTRLGARAALVGAFAVAVSYAATDEYHQRFVDGRVSAPRDVLIDTAGAATATVLLARRREVARP